MHHCYVLIASLALGALSTASGAEVRSDATTEGGIVYRCSMQDGGRLYSSKVVQGADCVAVSRYVPVPPEWEYITSSKQSNVYVRRDSFRRDGDDMAAWLLDNFTKPESSRNASAPYLSGLRRITVKCNTREISHQSIAYYSQVNGGGEHVGGWKAFGENSDFAPPGTVNDLIAIRVCRGKSKS